MFSIFKKNPIKEMQAKYERLMKEAMEAQRVGDIDRYSTLSAQADEVAKEIDALSSS